MNELCFGAQPRAKPGPERGSHWWQWMVDLSCQRSAVCSQWSCFCEGGIINSTYWLNIRWYGKAWTKLLANPIFFRWALGRKIEAFWDWILDKLGWEVCTKFAVGKMMIWAVNWKHKGWRPCLYLKKGWGQAALVPFLNLDVYHCSAQYRHVELLPHEEWLTEKLQSATHCIVCPWMMIALYFLYFLAMLSRFSHVQLCATLWTVAQQAPPSMGFSRQEYWSELPFPSSGDLPNPGIEAACSMCNLHWQAGSLLLAPPGKPLFLSIWIWSHWHITDFTWHMIQITCNLCAHRARFIAWRFLD